MKQKKKQIGIISCIVLALVALLGGVIWFMTQPKEQEKEIEVSENLNVEWYDENGTEFVISTADQLYEFAQLSSYHDFAGQTIKLGADIVFNEGDASEWGVSFPDKIWDRPIDGFAGTFDGQGHTISGIYCMGYLYQCSGTGLKPLPAGLFSNTKPECVIKNFKLVNSYFCGDLQDGAGTISACGGGTFDSIYSNATLVSYKYWNGGIIGKATEATTVTNCWFDGKIDIIGGYARYTGGIMGRAMNKDADFLIEHCLVTGTMYNETEKTGVGMGAILGNALESSEVTINDCFVNADLTNEYKVAVGSVYGVSEKNATVNLTNTYATNESYERMVGAVLGIANGMPIGYQEEMLKGNGGYQWTSLDFDKYWSIVENGTPILTTFAETTPSLEGIERYVDLSWYTDEATEYVLMDKADLYGFSLLTQSWDFKGKTVKLGADIVVNEGKASEWGQKAPALEWISIGPKSKPFAGTFDGQMHTISGIYLDSDVMNTGLFSVTEETSTIKNLRLKNSYFKSVASFTGSIVGQGRGTLDTVYSDAIITSSKGSIGGLIGLGYGKKVSMKNCWFAGTVTNTVNDKAERGTGGLIGTVYDDASARIENCLNTGTVNVKAYKFNQAKTGTNITPIAGGLVGWVRTKGSTLDIKHSLNTGKILTDEAATGGYGSILGYSDGVVTISDTYATTESSALTAAKINGWVLAFEEAKLIGDGGYKYTTLNFNKYWAAVAKGTPVLKSFAGKGTNVSSVSRMVDTSWYDEKADTYVLTDVADLYGFAYLANGTDFAGKTIKLGADIVVNTGKASDWAKTAPAFEWKSIASKNLPFAGTFDGQMHTISGIYVKADTRNNGFFAATGETSVIKNLKLKNSYITSIAGELGSIAGQGRGTFDTVYSDAIVVGSSSNIGGLVGMGYGTKVSMKNCWYAGTVTNTANHKNDRGTGGLVGTLYDGCIAKMEHCLNTGTVDVKAYKFDQNASASVTNITPIAGGLVGWVKTAKSAVSIEDCLNTGKVLTDATATGGYGAVVGFSENVKGTTVSITYSTVSPIAGSKVTGKIYEVSEASIAGYKGYQWTLLDFDAYWAVAEASTPVLKSFADKVPSLANSERMIALDWYDKAAGSKEDPYLLSTKKDLYGFAMLSVDTDYNAFKGKYVKLANDIVVNEGDVSGWDEWIPIGSKELPFAGTFDGDMHTISGIYLNADTRNSGLFSVTGDTSVIKNLKLSNSKLTSTAGELGSIAGQGRGTFDTVYSDAIVTGAAANTGGLVGMGYGTKVSMKNCWFAGTVTNTANHKNNRGTGGLIGTLYDGSSAKIENCLNSGTVDVTAYKFDQNTSPTVTNITPIAGGIVGWVKTAKSSASISDCLSTGKVLAASEATGGYGAIVGLSENVKGTIVSNLYTTVEPTTEGFVTGKVFLVTENEIKGYEGYRWTLLDFDNYWAVVMDGTPILKSFAKVVPSLEGVDNMLDTRWVTKYAGTSTDPYIISDKGDLYGLAMLSVEAEYDGFNGKYFKLDNDIVLNTGIASEWATKAPKYSWDPIGSKAIPFKGQFDGNMHAISGIYVNASTVNSGLFAVTGDNSVVKNLKVTNSYFKTTATAMGSIVGQGRGTLDTVYSDAIVVSSTAQVGGLVGMGYGAKLTLNKCWFAGSVTNTATASGGRGTGGLVGILYSAGKATMTNCLNSGIVDASSSTQTVPKAGGLTGNVEKNAVLTTTDCLNVGTVKVASGKLGGIIAGCIDGGNVTINTTYGYGVNCVVGYMQNSGKFVVNYVLNGTQGTADKTVNNNYVGNVPVVTSFQTQANFIGETARTKMEGFDFDKDWSVVPNSTPVLKAFEKEVYDISWYDANNSIYTLMDRGDLYGLAVLSQDAAYNGFAGKTIKLGADIIVNVGYSDTWANIAPSINWLPISTKANPFAGTFDGQMHAISGLYLNASVANVGLFSVTHADSKVQNLKVTNSYFTSTKSGLGSIVGQGRGLIDGVYSDATVLGAAAQVGGLVGLGYGNKLALNECWFAGSVTNTVDSASGRGTGGLVGIIFADGKATMNNCLNSGTVDVTASSQYVTKAGGFTGNVESKATLTITNCLNVGTIKVASGKLGGIVSGCIDGGTVTSNTSYGNGNICTVGYMQNSAKFTVNYVLNGTAGTANKSVANNYLGNVPVITSMRTFTGDAAKTSLEGFDFENVWSATESTPILEKFAK